MIEIIEFDLDYTPKGEHEELNVLLGMGFQIIGHAVYQDTDRHPWERFTLYKPDKAAIEPAQGELVMTTITSIQRDETKNNQRPMWRCQTATGEKVNIFLNVDDPSKDSFHLFEDAGWGDYLMGLFLYSEAFTEIYVAIRKDGQWWNIVAVSPAKPDSDSTEIPSVPDDAFDPEIYGNKDIRDDLGLEDGNE